jgi:hypothetical protein
VAVDLSYYSILPSLVCFVVIMVCLLCCYLLCWFIKPPGISAWFFCKVCFWMSVFLWGFWSCLCAVKRTYYNVFALSKFLDLLSCIALPILFQKRNARYYNSIKYSSNKIDMTLSTNPRINPYLLKKTQWLIWSDTSTLLDKCKIKI